VEVIGQPVKRTVYRRAGAVVFFVVIGLFLLGIAVAVTPAEARNGGWRGAAVPWALCVPAAALAVIAGVLPRLVVTDDHVEVHNLFVRYVIPYATITEAKFGRIGLALRTTGGRLVPVLAFGHSTVANLLTGDATGQRALADINGRVAYLHVHGGPEVQRTLKPVEISASAGLVALAAAVLIFV
jgi:hypothetical protein